jgi:hypothetical protein
MSLHQTNIIKIIVKKPKNIKNFPPEYPWKYKTPPKVSPKEPSDATNG